MIACLVNSWPQALAVTAVSALAGFLIKIKMDHPV
jgi:hypothetical protein